MLLEDSPRKKTFTYFRGHISRGELVRMTRSYQWIVAYSQPPIFIDCQEHQVKVVNPQLVPYLLAVDNLISRHNLYINKLDSLRKYALLNIGDKIDVMLELNAIPSAAIIRYKGSLPSKNGIFFGVELLVSKCYIIKYNCICVLYNTQDI